MSSPWTCRSLLLCSQAMSHSHIHMQASNVSVLLPGPRSHDFAFAQSYLGDLEVIRLPFCHLGAGLIFESGFLSVWWAALVPVPIQVLFCTQGPHPNLLGRWVPLLDQTIHWYLAGSLLLVVQGMHPSDKGGGKKPTISKSQISPQKCCHILKHRDGTLRQFHRKQHFIVLAKTELSHARWVLTSRQRFYNMATLIGLFATVSFLMLGEVWLWTKYFPYWLHW
jgi:hypothetical protein